MNKSLVKHVIFPLHEKLIGRKTYQYLDELEETQWLDPGRSRTSNLIN